MGTINYKVYKITNTITNKVYIGITRRSIEKRFDNHIKSSKKPKYKLHRSIHKHGIDKFTIETICENLSKSEALLKEREHIMLYNSYHDGYNSTTGGECPDLSKGRSHWSEESCKSFKVSRREWLNSDDGLQYRQRARERFVKLNPSQFVTAEGRVSAVKKYKEWVYNTDAGQNRRKQSAENMKRVQKLRHNGIYRLLSPDNYEYIIRGDIMLFCKTHNLSFHSFYYALKHKTINRRGPNAGWKILDWNVEELSDKPSYTIEVSCG